MTSKNNAKRLWNQKVADLVPYVPGEQPRNQALIKLNTNENPYPPAPEVLKAINDFPMETLRLYPDPTNLDLRQTIGEYYNLDISNIFVGNGSDEILAMVFQAFFNTKADVEDPGSSDCQIAFPDVTYSFYPVYAQMYDVPSRTFALADDFTLELDACLDPSAALVLANPNAPTGIAIDLDDLKRIAAADRNRLIVVDEAYVDFGAESAVSLLPEFDNILVVQTLSKSRSLAGIRVGFALGDPALIEALERIRDAFNSYTVDRLAQAVAIAAFEAGAYFEQCRARIIETREKCAAVLKVLGFEVLPSSANFLFARHPKYAGDDLYRKLREHGILVRHFAKPRIEDFLRITIGLPEDMDKLLAILENLVGR